MNRDQEQAPRAGRAPGRSLSSLRTRPRHPLATLPVRVLGAARLYRRLMLLERPLDEPIPDLPLPPGVTVRPLRVADVPAYLAFRPDRAAAMIERRLRDGEWGFAAWLDGAIVMASWTSPQRARIDYLDWELALAPDEAYSYDLYTAPAFRGRGLAAAARVSMLRDARERGCRRLLSALLPENAPGWRTPETLGFRQIGWIGYLGVGPWRRRLCRVIPGVRGIASA